MKKICVVLCCLLSFGLANAQQDPQISQNMFNKLFNNPGFAGTKGAICATALHRSQWMGFEDAPKTLNFSVDAALPMLHGGMGLNIVSDQLGAQQNLALQLSYSYHAKLGSGQIGTGISLGMFQSGADGGYYRSGEPNDPSIPTGNVVGSSLDLGGGIYFNTQDAYIGLSASHINEPVVEWTNGTTHNLKRHYFLMAGYYYELSSLFSFNPSIFLKSDGTTSQLDINSNIIYNNLVWGGVSYRPEEGIVVLTGMNITDDLRFGLAYDISISNDFPNSIEFMLGYCFKIKFTKTDSKYKNPRFL